MIDPSVAEEWRPIPGFPGYEASSLGAVRSWRRTGSAVHKGPRVTPLALKTYQRKNGYLSVMMSPIPGKRQVSRLVHQLVLEAFSGPRPRGNVARHFPDPSRTNNRASNLSWGTVQENADDGIVQGTVARGDKHGNAKLTEDDVAFARKSALTAGKVAAILGVTESNIDQIRARKTWKHVA